MTKPKHHPPQTPAEHAAEVARIRQMQAMAHSDHQPWAESHGECPTCGEAVEAVNAEPLDFDVQDGTLVATSMVRVMLPCGHTSIQIC
ncbi:hypothetical protein BJY16_001984 [Actinoplanes octamycinicus]|uniref:Uncharacterized protein n=1 Tax=Actinoplanes octamycinicus TaxID=135948 RepID=A0A7W7M6A0_9ACTN|nr:hypothetical protein [Actinoplanes octamycinicus]MBB4738525.1 hypothetical protein [Actinoplanes octamycinicus]GIE57647.1 hypothetical protein Aoc01nite_30490 [Actinoplanes octamycinicus]